MLHRIVELTDQDVSVVICPDCGQMEVWTLEEVWDHGICRCNPYYLERGHCPVCGEAIEWGPGE